MPLDKSRIQGFGSGGEVSEPIQRVTKCPAGHSLKQWNARQGSCDGCGRRVLANEKVMDCRLCNWYLCQTCVDRGPQASDWSAIVDTFATPGMKSALEDIALQVNDVIEAAAEDMKELGSEVKSAVAGALGLDSDEEEAGPSSSSAAQDQRRRKDSASPRSRKEGAKVVADFCEKYPATRVAPNDAELQAFVASCGALHPSAVASALYEQLSWAGGELEWQPRLRALYALERLHDEGGANLEITSTVVQNGEGLIQYLVEVHQCKEKASQVVLKLMGKTPDGQDAPKPQQPKAEQAAAKAKPKAKPKAEPKAKPKAKPAESADLLGDVSTPKASSSASSSAAPAVKANGVGLVDLMDAAPAPEAAPVLDLTAPAAEPAIQDLNLLGSAPAEASSSTDAFTTLDLTAAAAPPAAAPQPAAASLAAFNPAARTTTAGTPQLPLSGAGLGAAAPPLAGGLAALGAGARPGLGGPMAFGGALPFGSTPTSGGGSSTGWSPPAVGSTFGVPGPMPMGTGAVPAAGQAKAPGQAGGSLGGRGKSRAGGGSALDSLDALTAHLTGDFTSLTAPSTSGPPKGPPPTPGAPGGGGGSATAPGMMYIPAELSPPASVKDPFAFVSEHTGLETKGGK